MISNNFAPRHNGVSKSVDEEKMLKEIGVSSMVEIIDKAVPATNTSLPDLYAVI